MTDIRTDEVAASDIVAMAAFANENVEEVSADETASVTEEQPTQSELLRTGEQKREPRAHAFPNPGEGEHQMKGLFAEVNPIRPAMQEGDVRRAISVNVHQHGDVVASQYRDSRVYPGVNEHTDLAIANDTRVAGGRDVAGAILDAPDPEGIVKEETADITNDLLEQQEEGAAVVLPEPTDLEVPPFVDRISVMEYDEETEESTNPRSLSDIQSDKDEAYEEVEEALFPDPAERDEIEEYDATKVVAETDPEALATAQAERSEEEAKAQAEEEHLTPRPEDIGEEEPEIFTSPDTIVNAEEQGGTGDPYKDEVIVGEDDEEDVEETDTEVEDDEVRPPACSASKGEWVDYVVANYDTTQEDAEALTKEQLVETYGE